MQAWMALFIFLSKNDSIDSAHYAFILICPLKEIEFVQVLNMLELDEWSIKLKEI